MTRGVVVAGSRAGQHLLVFMMVNPLLFPPPRSTRDWASKGVFGERIWTDRDKAELPAQFRSRVLSVTYAIQVVGMAILVYGLEDMKARDPSYAGWVR